MGSRSRSIRLRIYFLVAIPLVAMVGLLAYVAGTSVNNAINLDRAPNLINATALPTANFVKYLQAERATAVVYLFQPTAANLAGYNTAIATTDQNEKPFEAAMTSPATVSSETPAEAKAINAVIGDLSQLTALRNGIKAGVSTPADTPLDALGLYSQGIAAEPRLFLAEANSETDATAVSQALGLIATVQAREQLSQEDALLAGMLAGQRISSQDRVTFTEAGATRRADLQYAQSILSPANLAVYNAAQRGSAAAQQNLTTIEQAVAAGLPISALGTSQAQWQQTAGTLLPDYYNGGVAIADAVLVADHQISRSAWIKVAVVGGIALLGLLITILMTTLVARGIIRRLRGLERSAITLAEKQLPDVIARLRRGEDVDVASEAPALRVGRDEIGRVGQSFDLVRQTAIRAAVDEARLRRGLNDVFRSLARRSQSLLHRQLTLLDQMERRATDPEALDDLFRLDHLTTRMRRHAEGLVILAGAPPGRAWSSPVRMVDVMRGAIAEVEDYARVAVATRSQAALSGSAVADVIHLLAELIENATTLSPPYTSVRVSGDTVANGFVIEVEDRGLGMSPPRLAELNERLASPPEFNPSDTEQLGLFVVGQLAKRHGIRVTLKASPYGGTAAIVLIPRHLVVTEEAFRAGLPGEPAAIAMAPVATNGRHGTAELTGPSGPGFSELPGLPGSPEAPGIRISGALRRSEGIITESRDGLPAEAGPPAEAGLAAGSDERPERPDQAAAGSPNGTGQSPGGAASRPDLPRPDLSQPDLSQPDLSQPDLQARPSFDVFTPLRHAEHAGETPVAAAAGLDRGPGDTQPNLPAVGAGTSEADSVNAAGSYVASPPYPAVPSPPYPAVPSPPHPAVPSPPHPAGTSSPYPGPGPGSAPYPDEPAPFPGWTSLSSGRGAANSGSQGTPSGPPTPMRPVASGPASQGGQGSRPPWELSRQTGPLPMLPGESGEPSQAAEPDGDGKGLPRRVRQASLAPQLRADPPQRRVTVVSSGPPSGPTPAEIRETMSALQRGWQEGRRSEQAPGQGAGEPPAGTDPPPDAAPSPGADQSHDSTADEEARGESDGT